MAYLHTIILMVFHFFDLEVKEICSYRNFLLQVLGRNATDAMRESRVPDVLSSVRHLIIFQFLPQFSFLFFFGGGGLLGKRGFIMRHLYC